MVLSSRKLAIAFAVASCFLHTISASDVPSEVCSLGVSAEDAAKGLDVVTDAQCATGGDGCIDKICRHCTVDATTISTEFPTYPNCADLIQVDADSSDLAGSSVVDNADGESSGSGGSGYGDQFFAPGDAAPGDTAPGDTAIGDAAPGGVGALPDNLMGEDPIGASSPGAPPGGAPPGAAYYGCGLGCYADVCRFCKFKESPQSAHLLTCERLGYYIHSSVPTPPDFTTVDIVDPREWAATTGCPTPTTPGDYATGTVLAGDKTCSKGGIGCYGNACRFCKFQETLQSKNWVTCESMGYKPAGQPIGTVQDITDSLVTNCPYPTTPGDYATGTLLVGDTTCSKGGLGCYANACRFCKFQETPQSKNWVTCESMGYTNIGEPISIVQDITEPPVNPDTGCAYSVSGSEFVAGIRLVGDASCARGGADCFKNVCRKCKVKDSAMSMHLRPCSDFGYPRTLKPVPVIVPVRDQNWCSAQIAPGHVKGGISAIYDGSCSPGGGIGCFSGVCRYCQVYLTDKSKDFVHCPTSTTQDVIEPVTPKPAPVVDDADRECKSKLAIGHTQGGISAVYDTRCASGSIVGCFADSCRYCQIGWSDKSKDFLPCSGTAPTPTLAPEPTPVVGGDPSGICRSELAIGHTQGGISALFDTACGSGGVGCFNTVCRYCQVFWSAQSKDFVSCSGTTPTQPPTAAPMPIDGGDGMCTSKLAVGHTQGGIGARFDASCVSGGGVGCFDGVCRYCQAFYSESSKDYVPCSGTSPTPTQPPVPIPGPTPNVNTPCPYNPAGYEVASGIRFVGDASCAVDGLNCYMNVCRKCKFKDTAMSLHLPSCAEFGLPSEVTPAPAPTEAPTPMVGGDGICTSKIAVGHTQAGIGALFDTSCVSGGAGCFDGVCRYCQVFYSESSKDYVPCSGTSPTPTQVPGPLPGPTPTQMVGGDGICTSKIAVGHTQGGIGAMFDTACVSGGAGCFDGVCRYCQVFYSESSKDFQPCSGAAPLPTQAPGPLPAPTPTVYSECPYYVAGNEYAAGIRMFSDPSCVDNSAGCYKSVCRQCQVKSSALSMHLPSCADYGYPFVKLPTPAPAPAPGPIVSAGVEGCKAQLAVGHTEGGIGALYDTSCVSGGVGCFGEVCRYCMDFWTDSSKDFPPCRSPGEPAPVGASDPAAPFDPSVGAAAPGADVPPADADVPPTDAGVPPAVPPSDPDTVNMHVKVVRPLRAAAKEHSTRSASSTDSFDKLLEGKAFQWAIVGAACVGVVAVVVLVALGTKRAVTRRRNARSTDVSVKNKVTEVQLEQLEVSSVQDHQV